MSATPLNRHNLMPQWAEEVALEETSPLIRDWVQWLTLSRTPEIHHSSQPFQILRVRNGELADPLVWPMQVLPRVYVAYDDEEAVYAGKTSQRLATRIRRHLSGDRLDERIKAGTWEFVVTAAFGTLTHGELEQLETSAACWILPQRRRVGRRHPVPHQLKR